MMRKLGAFVIAATVAAAIPAHAQTVDEIVGKYIAARGGLEQLKSVRTLRMKGTMNGGPGQTAPIVIEMKRPSMMRMDMTVEGTTGTQAFDGTSGWVLMPFAGMTKPDRMPLEVVKEAAAQADFDGPLVDYAAKGHRVELVGRERVDGKDTWRLAVTLKNGSRRTIYLDAATYLEVKSTGERSLNGRQVQSETVLGDYRTVDGLRYPFSMESGLTDMPQKQTMTIESIEVNVPVDDERFRMPRS